MGMRKSRWQAYYPEDGETTDDARALPEWDFAPISNLDSAAEAACRHDYDSRDGWERQAEESFPIVVIDPQGKEHRFRAWHAPSVNHHVKEMEQDDAR